MTIVLGIRQVAAITLPPISYPPTIISGSNDLGSEPANKQSRAAVLFAGSDAFELTLTDPVVSADDYGETEWQEIPRPGHKPWLVRSGGRLKKLNVKGMIYAGGRPIDVDLGRLFFMSSRAPVVTFSYGSFEAGQWRLTQLAFETQVREAGTNNVVASNFTFTLTEASDIPTPKPVPNAPAPPPVPAPAAKTDPPKASYTVKKGDTLSRIALKFYGNATTWPRIADANGIKDPRKLAIGKVLVIP